MAVWLTSVVLLGVLGGTAPSALAAPPLPAGWESDGAADHPLVGQIWDGATGEALTPGEALRRMARADYLLLGEVHDNPDHHRLQAWIIAGLIDAGRPPGVAWEMLDWDRQAELSTYRGEAADLGPALKWEESGWPDWTQYLPIAEAAMSGGGVLLAADAPMVLQRRVARQGLEALSAKERERLALDRPWPALFTTELLQEMVTAHCDLVPADRLSGMSAMQRLRDGAMAATLVEERARQIETVGQSAPLVLIAGAGHVRPDRGVPWYLKALDPQGRGLSLSFVEVREGALDPANYAHGMLAGQLLWFTPVAERGDPCETLRQQFEAQRG